MIPAKIDDWFSSRNAAMAKIRLRYFDAVTVNILRAT